MYLVLVIPSVQFSSSCLTLCDPMDCSTSGLPVHHHLPEFTQTHVHRVGDAIQPSHPLSSPSPSAPNPSQHQGLFQWVSFSHQVAKVLEFQLQHQSFQWRTQTDLLVQFSYPLQYTLPLLSYFICTLFPISGWEDWGSSETKWSSIFSRRVELDRACTGDRKEVCIFIWDGDIVVS